MENGVVNVANRLDPEAFDVQFCCLATRGEFADRLIRNGDCIDVLGKPPGKSLRTVWRLMNAIRRVKPDVVHTHNLATLIYAAPATWWGRSVPLLHGVHSEMPEEEQTAKRLALRRRFYGAAKSVQTVTIGLTRHLEALGLNNREIATVTNGVDTTVFRPDQHCTLRAELGIAESAFVVGMVARFGAYKRHEAALAAFDELAGEFPDFHLVFVGGSGPRKEAVEARRAASQFSDRVHLAGFRSLPAEVYPAFNVLAIPSIREGLSNAALEAMASGVPVLTNAACGAADAVTHGADGWIADLTDHKQFVAALRDALLAREQNAEFATRARAVVIERFSMKSMVAGYGDLYRRIADG